jgi:hypothetical protein
MERAETGRRDGVVIFLAALALYSYTLAPGLQWGDSAALALQVHDSALHLRSAGDHPLYVLLGMAFSLLPGDLARNLNLLSAVAAALAVALTSRIASRLSGARSAGWFAAAALAVSHAFWLHAVITEVYTLNALFVVLLVWLLLEWRDRGQSGGRLAVVALVFLVGLTNHLVLAGLLPAIFVFVIATNPGAVRAWAPRLLGLCAGGALLTFWLLPDPGATLSRIVHGPPPITQYFRLSSDLPGLGREVLFYVLYLCYEFPVAGLVVGLWGFDRLRRRDPRAAALVGIAIVVNAGVFINNTWWPSPGSTKYVFYIQDYTLFAILVGYGAWEGVQRWSREMPSFVPILAAVLLSVPIVAYCLAPLVLERSGIDLLRARHLPYRDATIYFLTPSKRGDDSARRFGEAALAAVEPGAALVGDYTPRSVLEYLQRAHGMRRDVLLLAPAGPWGPIDLAPLVARHAGRPIYLAGMEARYYNINTLREQFDFIPIGSLYRLRERSPKEAALE